MRLTLILNKQSHRFMLKRVYERKGIIKEPPFRMPKYLQQIGIKLVDPTKKEAVEEKWIPAVPDDPRFTEEPKLEDHPDYHEEHVYKFTPNTKLLEGENQALLLSKTQSFQGLPSQVTDLIGAVEIPDQDLLVQRYIMQANKWNPTKEKIPKRFNAEIPRWCFKAEYGIPQEKKIFIMYQNLLRLCQSLSKTYPDLVQSRRLARDAFVSCLYKYKGEKTIMLEGEQPFLMTTNRPLKPFASEEQTDASVSHTLPDLFPIAPTIDLIQEQVYKEENLTGWRDDYSHTTPHTLFVEHAERDWSESEKNAKSLLFCLAHTASYAQQKYGVDVTTLPEPVSMQCVSSDGTDFNFFCFQLNTLNLSSKDGVKNLFWMDSDNALFKRIEPKRGMLRHTRYEDYDGNVFRKLMAMYLNGAVLKR